MEPARDVIIFALNFGFHHTYYFHIVPHHRILRGFNYGLSEHDRLY
jgi:hypothetical protein